MLRVRGLRKSFAAQPPRLVLADIDLDLRAGELIAIMGESGAGKSTLLNIIAGLDEADSGSITLDEVELTALAPDARSIHRRANFGFIFQAFHLLPYLDVADNIALPLLLNGWTQRERDSRVQALLSAVALADRASAKPRELSGGEMQRVAIARALAPRPKLILADEPTGNLDAAHAEQVLRLLRESVGRERTACILVTHSRIAAAIADSVFALSASGLQRVDPQ